MNDSSYHVSSTENTSFEEDQPKEDVPQFGVIDIVEAFTAMRHEWRGQTKESRQLAEQIQAAVATLGELEAKLLDRLPENSLPDSGPSAAEDAKRLAQLIAEIDHQFTRAVRAIEQAEINRRRREEEQAGALDQYFSSRNFLVRWFARPLMDFLTEQRQRDDHAVESPAVEGLNFVLARLRRSMKELYIERVETQGQPFDANIMNAIGTIESSEHPSGHVAEQFSPGYRWQGQLLRFADVRVAK